MGLLDILELLIIAAGEGEMADLLYWFGSTISAIVFVIAVVQCFWGYKLFKLWIAIYGFFLSGLLGTMLAMYNVQDVNAAIFIGLLSAIVGAFITYKLYLAGVFLSCGLMGFVIVYALTQETSISVVLAIVVGIFGVVFVKPVIILSTSIPYGFLAGASLAAMLRLDGAMGNILGVLFAILGIYIQFSTGERAKLASSETGPVHAPVNTDTEATVANTMEVAAAYTPEGPDKEDDAYAEEAVLDTNNSDTVNFEQGYCIHCGSASRDGHIYCTNCGNKIRS